MMCPPRRAFPLPIVVLLLTIFISPPPIWAEKKAESSVAASVFKFIYNNEEICGDMFANASWFPARHQCELRCRMDSEICQMSSEAMAIRRQRCMELPLECRRRLRQLVGGQDLYTTPNKRLNPIVAAAAQRKQRNSKEYGNTKSNQKPARGPIPTPQPRQIQITPTKSANPELVPLSKHNDILIHPAQFLSTTISSRVPEANNRPRPKSMPAPMSREVGSGRSKLPKSTEKPSKAKAKHVASPAREKAGATTKTVDDSLQRMFQELYREATAEKAQTISTGFPTLMETVTTTPVIPKKQSSERSMELFAGNPFGPGAPVPGAQNGNADQAIHATVPIEQQQPVFELFGPPINQYQLQMEQQQREYTLVQGPGSSNRPPDQQLPGYVLITKTTSSTTSTAAPTPPMATTTSPTDTAQQLFGLKTTNGERMKEKDMPKTMEEVFRRQIPWWTWRDFAEALRQQKPFGADADGRLLLSVDKSARCCQWALDGLCDRSWQRVRELCPKSCGSLVCSSIEGTLSCRRTINVDVVSCYEQRRRASHIFGAPSIFGNKSPENEAQKRRKSANFEFETEDPGSSDSEEEAQNVVNEGKRAFAVESEIKNGMKMGKDNISSQDQNEEDGPQEASNFYSVFSLLKAPRALIFR